MSNWPSQLRQALVSYFDDAELEALCFDMRIDYGALAGDNRTKRVIELIELASRSGRIGELIDLASQQRPNVPWSDIRTAAVHDPHVYPIPPELAHPARSPAPALSASPAPVPPTATSRRPMLAVLAAVGVLLLGVVVVAVLRPLFGFGGLDSQATPTALALPTQTSVVAVVDTATATGAAPSSTPAPTATPEASTQAPTMMAPPPATTTPVPPSPIPPTTQPAATPAATPLNVNFAGTWSTNFAALQLEQNGSNVTGTYTRYGYRESLPIEGVVEVEAAGGGRLRGFYQGDPAKRFEFVLGRDGNSFDGNWDDRYQWCGVRAGPLPDGCGFSGKWNTIGYYSVDYQPTAQLVQTGNRVEGTFLNGVRTSAGQVRGTLGARGVGSQYTLTGTWVIGQDTGPLTWVLVNNADLTRQQFQGRSGVRGSDVLEWCGWRDGFTRPSPCAN